MQGFCNFRIMIIDINDHPPKFEKENFEESIPFTSAANSVSNLSIFVQIEIT